ncbi:hypothetical protein RB614_02895 [Phytohabitans sp. ZYX-F-186]|uniref:Ribbon-helix-helix protein CopG domain-containing protein n=1 Tax=Phytohabitans maris TaxID=3071409 RepID=A0ABU0Z8S2_9ACTN|nr:hypothetical protein [Phytohabitans sp. ZYX-F-186]MDQ7903461.1 hypothetical protein [Phytohabitans sp. ZYX-F-186]
MDTNKNRAVAVREQTEEKTVEPETTPPSVPPTAASGSPGGLVRVTVNLTPKSADALEAISGATGLSKTDVINRSLQVYQLVEELLDRGGGSILIKHPSGELERVYIL